MMKDPAAVIIEWNARRELTLYLPGLVDWTCDGVHWNGTSLVGLDSEIVQRCEWDGI